MTEAERIMLTADSYSVQGGVHERNVESPIQEEAEHLGAEAALGHDTPLARTYRVADAHAHIYPTKIAAKATASVGKFYNIEMAVEDGLPETLLAKGATINCKTFLVCSVATKAEQVMSITDYIAGECAAHPEFIGLGAYHQDVTDPVPVLDHIQELGLVGVKVHPDFQQFDIDDPKVMPFYEECAKRDMPVLIHMGDPRYDYSAPIRLARVLDHIPDLKAIAAHFGGYQRWDEVGVLAGSNAMFDTSSSLWWISREKANELIDLFGVDHMMFGVDFPMWDHKKEFERFLAVGRTEKENQKILYDNFARLFALED